MKSMTGPLLILGSTALAADTASALKAQSPERTIVSAGSWSGEGREPAPDHRLELTEPVAARALQEVLAAVAPSDIAVLVRSESPLTPAREGAYDSVIAKSIATAIARWRRAGGAPQHLTILSATAVYGLARVGPILFEDSGGVGEDAAAGTPYGLWVAELRESERAYARVANEVGARFTILRAAPVVCGPVASVVSEYLASPMPVRVLGHDPPVQVLHYSDLVTAVACAICERPGLPMNIVGLGVVPLSRVSALAGRVSWPLPQPLAARFAHRSPGTDFLSSRCIADGSRAEETMAFRASYTAEEALRG